MYEDARPIAAESGRGAAMIVYILYLLSIPSAALFALAGVVLAFVARGGATGVARAHLDNQIRFWWIAFFWGVALAVLTVIGWVLTPVLIGFPILWIAGLIGLIILIWFTIKAFLGLLALLDGRPVR